MGSEEVIIEMEKTQAALDTVRAKYECPGQRLAIITPVRYQEAKNIFEHHFIPDEPLCNAFGTRYDSLINGLVEETLHSNLSICMISEATNEMMGFRIVGVMRKSDPPMNFDAHPTSQYRALMKFLCTKDEEVDFYGHYGVDEAAHFFTLGVHAKYRRQGLGSRLLGAAVAMSKELGYKAIKGEGTSNFSQRIYEKEGFDILGSLSYDEYKTPDGHLISERSGPHTCTKIYGLRI